MRIITGREKGRKLISRDDTGVRPTQDRTKEAVFNMLGSLVIDVRGLDLFAGFGGIGLEAISRGAEHFTFVEKDSRNVKTINKNIELCGFEKKTEVYNRDVFNFLNSHFASYNLVFMDPPYQKGFTDKTLSMLMNNNLVEPGGIIVCEFFHREEINVFQNLKLLKERQYGDSAINIYQLKGDINDN